MHIDWILSEGRVQDEVGCLVEKDAIASMEVYDAQVTGLG